MPAITICLLHITVILYAQNVLQRIDSFATALYNDHEMNGNLLVASKGKVVYKRSFGYADVAANMMNNDSSAFQLASVSKIFTAVAILQLKEKGKL